MTADLEGASAEDKKTPGDQKVASDDNKLPEIEAEDRGNAAADKSPKTLFQLIKDGKELVTIIVFFIGVIIWLYEAFATKHYVAGIKCLLGATIERIDNDAQSRILNSDILENNIRLQQIQASDKPIIETITEREATKQKIEDLKAKKSLADQVAKKAAEKVNNGECSE